MWLSLVMIPLEVFTDVTQDADDRDEDEDKNEDEDFYLKVKPEIFNLKVLS